jgi:hypothetical protein
MSTRTALGRRTGDDHHLSGYDLFLLVLPMPLLLGFAAATATSIPLSAGAGLGSIPSAALLAYGLFVDGPTGSTREVEGAR